MFHIFYSYLCGVTPTVGFIANVHPCVHDKVYCRSGVHRHLKGEGQNEGTFACILVAKGALERFSASVHTTCAQKIRMFPLAGAHAHSEHPALMLYMFKI